MSSILELEETYYIKLYVPNGNAGHYCKRHMVVTTIIILNIDTMAIIVSNSLIVNTICDNNNNYLIIVIVSNSLTDNTSCYRNTNL